jgi:hypothetical protein
MLTDSSGFYQINNLALQSIVCQESISQNRIRSTYAPSKPLLSYLYELAIIFGVYHMCLCSKTNFSYDNQMKTITRIKQYEQIRYNFHK